MSRITNIIPPASNGHAYPAIQKTDTSAAIEGSADTETGSKASAKTVRMDEAVFGETESAEEIQYDPYAKYKEMSRQLERFQEINDKNKSSADNISKKLKEMAKTQKSSSVSNLYVRMAGAGSKSQINMVMSETRRNISSLRMAASTGDSKERLKAQAAISSLQKLLLRGSKKKKRLNEEELLKARQKRAEKKKQEQQLKLELQKKQIKRKLADRGIMLEGHLDDVNNAYRFQCSDRADAQMQSISASYAAGISGASSAGIPAAVSPAGASVTSAELPSGSFSETV